MVKVVVCCEVQISNHPASAQVVGRLEAYRSGECARAFALAEIEEINAARDKKEFGLELQLINTVRLDAFAPHRLNPLAQQVIVFPYP